MRTAAQRTFLGGQSTSLLGDGFALLAVPLLVLHLTRDPFAAALSAAPRGVGYLLVGLPAGPIVDRLDPWTVLIVTDAIRASVFLVLPWLGADRLWTILALAFLAGAATVFFDAALAVAVKDLFHDEELLSANAILETATQTARVLGPALVGVLAATAGIGFALLVNAGTFLVSLASLIVVARSRVRVASRGGALVRDFAEGVRFLVATRALLVLTIVQTLVNLCLAVDTLFVFFARDTLALSVPKVATVVAGAGAAGILGAVLAPWFAARIAVLPLIALSIVVVAGALVLLSVSTSWWPLLVADCLQAAAVTVASVVNRSLRLALIPRELIGRVTTTVRACFVTATALGAVLAGAVTSASGDDPRPAFRAAGVLIAVIMGVGWFGGLRRFSGEGRPRPRGSRPGVQWGVPAPSGEAPGPCWTPPGSRAAVRAVVGAAGSSSSEPRKGRRGQGRFRPRRGGRDRPPRGRGP
jgi:MFS family permease